jgi:hypothetical protein
VGQPEAERDKIEAVENLALEHVADLICEREITAREAADLCRELAEVTEAARRAAEKPEGFSPTLLPQFPARWKT